MTAHAAPLEAAMASSAQILVVDDNEQNRALAQAALEDEGYRVVCESSGEAGIAAFVRDQPDCILLDVRMPGIDGLQACTRIRALSGGPETPIVFLTALRDIDTFERALAAGADDFLTKPVRPAELIARVQALLKARRMSAELREHYRADQEATRRLDGAAAAERAPDRADRARPQEPGALDGPARSA